MPSGGTVSRKPGAPDSARVSAAALRRRAATQVSSLRSWMRPIAACISVMRQLVPKLSWTQLNRPGAVGGRLMAS